MDVRRIVDDRAAARLIETWLAEPWTPCRNCWRLAAEASRELYGRALPLRPFAGALPARAARAELFAAHPERARWREVQAPEDGALVLMSRSRGDEHCGIFVGLGRGAVLHRDAPHGTVLDMPIAVTALRGWRMTFHVPDAEA